MRHGQYRAGVPHASHRVASRCEGGVAAVVRLLLANPTRPRPVPAGGAGATLLVEAVAELVPVDAVADVEARLLAPDLLAGAAVLNLTQTSRTRLVVPKTWKRRRPPRLLRPRAQGPQPTRQTSRGGCGCCRWAARGSAGSAPDPGPDDDHLYAVLGATPSSAQKSASDIHSRWPEVEEPAGTGVDMGAASIAARAR